MQSYQGTVGVVQAQPVYTLELAMCNEQDVAHKEYRDYTRAKQAFDDAVRDVKLYGELHAQVTRIELFSEAVGSMEKWVRGEPALASPVEVQRVAELAKILPACKTPEGTIEWLKDEACKQYALRVAAVEECDVLREDIANMRTQGERRERMVEDLQSELTKAREELKQAQVCERFVGYLLDNCEREVIYEESLQHWMAEMLAKEANQSAPADKDVQP